MKRPAMAAAPAAMTPGRWIEAAPVAGVGEAAALSAALVALTRGVEELARRLIEGVALERGVLVITGVQVEVEVEVDVGVGVGVEDGGGV